MRASYSLLWVAVTAVAAFALAWSARGGARAQAELSDARQQLQVVREQADELMRLRALASVDTERPTAPEDLPRRVSAVIRSCGLPASAMGSFDAGGSVREGEAVVRRASLVLKGVSLPQTGRFLSEWRLAEPKWMVAGVELSPRGDPPAAGGDLPLQAVISMESTVLAPGATP